MPFAGSKSRKPSPSWNGVSPRRSFTPGCVPGRARALVSAAAGAFVVLGAVLRASAPAAIVALDRAAVERAITIGQSSDAVALDRFYATYRVDIADALLERLDIVTPFRRIVNAAAERARHGDAAWSATQALESAASSRDRISLVLSVRFPPQNVYVTMPAFEIVLYGRAGTGGASTIEPIEVRGTPRDAAGVAVSPGSPIVRGSVEAVFDARRLDPRGVYVVGIRQQGRELRRVEVDFGKVD
jgi:hypothetical protein